MRALVFAALGLAVAGCNLKYRDEQHASFDACWVRAPESRLAFRENGRAAYSDASGVRELSGRLDVYGSVSFFERDGDELGDAIFKFCRLIDDGDALQCETNLAGLESPVRFEFARKESIVFEADDACGVVFGATGVATTNAGTTSSASTGAGGAGGAGGGGQCAPLGQACSAAGECCSGRCTLGSCSVL